ncbi:BamA/OMP85 family outer membrane protein [Deinococcus pimensis]|uniref:BamA/OMP85 family outer membrane protein n=1 Tax=Deinococcus pimensis TaxID=309888 RepID=UPI0004873120|nr:POTRA domain-containing protein [Deinococcus pimensis]
MRNTLTLGLTIALVGAPLAQAQQTATLDDIVVVGADDLLSNFLRVSLSVQTGAPLSSVNLRAVEAEALATGFFKTARAELTTQNGRQVLRLNVAPNPPIADVQVSGTPALNADELKRFLEQNLNIAAGATLNTARVEDSKVQIGEAYQENGFPFVPGVSVEVREGQNGATLVYTINESAPVNRVEISGNTRLPAETLQNAFRPLVDAKSFTLDAYRQALATVSQAYANLGLQGSGVNAQASSLADGTLKVTVTELRVGSVDTSAVQASGVTLQSRAGQLLDLNVVGQDVRALSNATGKAVGVNYQQDPTQTGVVNVVFVPQDVATGPIREVRVAGNTAVSADDIARILKVRLNDVYTPQLAQEDYLAIQRLYNSRGYELSTRDPIRFENGVLTFNVREVRLAGYELVWDGPKVTQERVVLRELPEPGGPLNTRALLARVSNNVARLGFVQPVSYQFRPDPNNPELVTYVLTLREQRTGILSPAISYDTLNGLSGDLSYSTNNLFGLGHSVSVSVTGAPNDARQFLSANASYTIPWLDIDVLDFRRVRTSLSLRVGTNVTGNNDISDVDPADPTKLNPTGRQFSTRTTGASVSLARPVAPNLSANATVSTQYNQSYLEPQKDGQPADAVVADRVPAPGLTTSFGVGLNYDTSNSVDFPTSGVRASTNALYGFGYQGTQGLSWWQVDGGARTYFGFGNTLNDGSRQQAFAVRANAGTIFGSPPASGVFFVGGSEPSDRFTLRGYEQGTISGRNFFTASAEYRYNFNVNVSVLQGLYGILFVDAGDAWNDASQFNVNLGYGAGVQLNLGLGSFALPYLRFDYAFSPVNPRGKFTFRIGSFF